MAKITIIFAAALIALGLVGYFGTPTSESSEIPAGESSSSEVDAGEAAKGGKRSVTAFIPAFFGLPMLLCGLLALKESLRMHAMHGAVLIGLLGALAGAGRGGSKLGAFLSGDPDLNTRGFMFVWLMTLICAAFVALCVRSFMQARRQRKLAESQSI